MSRIAVSVLGLDELYRGLEMRKSQVGEMMREALEAGAEVVAQEADRLAPEGGYIRVETKSKEAVIGFDEDKWYWRFFETGATSHEVRGTPLVFEGDAGLVVTGRVSHPGMPAKPFLRPALDGKKDEALRKMSEVVRRRNE